MSKYVESWFVTKYPNNVYTLVINTTQRYCHHDYVMQSDKYITFVVHPIKNYSNLNVNDITLEIPNFLPKIDGIWLRSSSVEKDQIYYYFIPHLKEYIKTNEIILISTDKTIKDDSEQ